MAEKLNTALAVLAAMAAGTALIAAGYGFALTANLPDVVLLRFTEKKLDDLANKLAAHATLTDKIVDQESFSSSIVDRVEVVIETEFCAMQVAKNRRPFERPECRNAHFCALGRFEEHDNSKDCYVKKIGDEWHYVRRGTDKGDCHAMCFTATTRPRVDD